MHFFCMFNNAFLFLRLELLSQPLQQPCAKKCKSLISVYHCKVSKDCIALVQNIFIHRWSMCCCRYTYLSEPDLKNLRLNTISMPQYIFSIQMRWRQLWILLGAWICFRKSRCLKCSWFLHDIVSTKLMGQLYHMRLWCLKLSLLYRLLLNRRCMWHCIGTYGRMCGFGGWCPHCPPWPSSIHLSPRSTISDATLKAPNNLFCIVHKIQIFNCWI